jgi:hypothetical protein
MTLDERIADARYRADFCRDLAAITRGNADERRALRAEAASLDLRAGLLSAVAIREVTR